MKIEVFCDGCDDCELLNSKVCQAVTDLNLDAQIISHHNPKKNVPAVECGAELRLRINGLMVSAKRDCSVRDLMLILNKELHLHQ